MLVRTFILASAIPMTASLAFAQEARVIDLASALLKEGAAPDGCRASLTGGGGSSVWKVVDKPASASGKTIVQMSRENIDARYPLCVVDSVKATDVELGVDFRPLEGLIDQAAGLIFRTADENNYYIVRANALENNVHLYHTVKGVRQQFAGANAPVEPGKTQHLGVRIEGDLITVFLQGKQLFEARDRTFSSSGAVGVWTKADSVTAFSNFTVKVLKE